MDDDTRTPLGKIYDKIDATRQLIAQTRIAVTIGDGERAMEFIEKSDAMAFEAALEIEAIEAV